MCLYTACMQYPRRPEGGVMSLETGVTNGLLAALWVLEIERKSFGRAASVLTTEPSL